MASSSKCEPGNRVKNMASMKKLEEVLSVTYQGAHRCEISFFDPAEGCEIKLLPPKNIFKRAACGSEA